MEFLQQLCELILLRIAISGGEDITDTAISYESVQDWENAWYKLVNTDTQPAKRYRRLLSLCAGNGNPFTQAVITLALAELVRPAFSALMTQYGGVTLETAQKLWCIEGDSEELGELVPLMRETYDNLSPILFCKRSSDPFFRHVFTADERLILYISGDNRIDTRLLDVRAAYVTPNIERPPIYMRENLVERVVDYFKMHRAGDLLQILGSDGIGKKLVLKHALKQCVIGMLFVDMRLIYNHKHIAVIIELIHRELLLNDCGVCFYGITSEHCSDNNATAQLLEVMVKPLSRHICVLLTSPDIELIACSDTYMERVEFTPFTRSEQLALWRGYGNANGLPQLDYDFISGSFKLNGGQIKKAVERLARYEGELDHTKISEACMAVLPPPQRGGIVKQKSGFGLDDLKLPEDQKQQMLNICAHVIHRHKVYDEWGMEKKYPYGRNVSALFVGVPGTGKTMAAYVMSNMLNIPLYRINLSQVIDKYIGETEKRLEEIFETAEKSNTILFFDEADAIFGKRSEVNDSKDRYANNEVSYILQRIEQYDGIVLLASNYKKNIDEAFMRRMRYLIEFQMPSKQIRKEIWQSCFTDGIPCSEIDFAFLSHQFELAGGAIKNIVLNSVFMAAEQNQPVDMRIICESIRQENLKLGKTMIRQDFADYGHVLNW